MTAHTPRALFLFYCFFCLLSQPKLLGQEVNINTNIPNEKALLDVSSTQHGMMAPRLTTVQRTALIANGSSQDSVSNSLLVFDTDIQHYFFWSNNAKKWQEIAISGDIFPYPSINVRQFGAKGDNSNDDTGAFNSAITAANAIGAAVYVPVGIYRITSTLNLPAGVTLMGESSGDKPLQVSTKGSLLYFWGNGLAIRMSGSNASMKNIGLINRALTNENHGIRLEADAALVESITLENVIVTDFILGTAVELKSMNGGGIAYCTFYDMRLRNAKIGIKIEQDETSFVNSCTFTGGAISGGAFDYCLLVNGGGNNHKFIGTVFEPYSSQFGHIVVNQGQIWGIDIRVEGNSQAPTVPLVYFGPSTYGSILSGIFAGGLIQDMGNNLTRFRSGKSIGIQPPSDNLLENATFSGNDNNIPYWKLTSVESATVTPPSLMTGHNVLSITIPIGTVGKLAPDSSFAPKHLAAGVYSQVNFGYFVKTAQTASVYATFNAPAGMTTSAAHTGDNTWQFVSMNAFSNPNAVAQPSLMMNNSAGSQPLVVQVTAPTFNFGIEIPPVAAKPVTTGGGILTGTLSMGMDSVNYVPPNGYLILDKNGNLFEINSTQAIHRINEPTGARFPKGTVISLLFDNAGVTVSNNTYLKLKSAFTSTVNGSLTLVSLGNGTWREVGRNN